MSGQTRYVVSRCYDGVCIVDLQTKEVARFGDYELYEIQVDADDLNEGKEVRELWTWTDTTEIDIDTLRELHDWEFDQ